MRAPLLGVALCLALAQTPAEAAGKQVRLAYVEWADAVVATNILKLALEEKGYEVKAIPLAAAAMWLAVSTYWEAKRDEAPLFCLDLLQRWIAQLDKLMAPPAPPPQAVAEAPGMLPPGAAMPM